MFASLTRERTASVQCIAELHDLLLLRIPVQHLASITANVDSNSPSLTIEWEPQQEDDTISLVVEELISTVSFTHPNVAVSQPTVDWTDAAHKKLYVEASDVEPEGPIQVGEGEPIPSDESFPVSMSVGDVAFDIANYNGVTYIILRNGEQLEGEYPSMAYAVGALMEYILLEVAEQEATNGTPDPDQTVDRDFLFSISKFLRSSSIIPDDTARKHLVDFVELTTLKDFDA